jgi:hypothetical protein
MRSGALIAAVVLASVSVLAASQEPKKSDKDNKTITMKGCVDGGYLIISNPDFVNVGGSYHDRFRLAGPKQLLKEIAAKRHGNKIEVTGRVIDSPRTEHAGQTTQIGKKATVYVGASAVPDVPNGESTSTIQVKSYVETEEACETK